MVDRLNKLEKNCYVRINDLKERLCTYPDEFYTYGYYAYQNLNLKINHSFLINSQKFLKESCNKYLEDKSVGAIKALNSIQS